MLSSQLSSRHFCWFQAPLLVSFMRNTNMVSMLWFKFILGLMFFELVSIVFVIVPHYGNEYMTKENKIWTSFKNFAPRLNLNDEPHRLETWKYCLWINLLEHLISLASFPERFLTFYHNENTLYWDKLNSHLLLMTKI